MNVSPLERGWLAMLTLNGSRRECLEVHFGVSMLTGKLNVIDQIV